MLRSERDQPIRTLSDAPPIASPSPTLGQDDDYVYRGLRGLGAEELEGLRTSGAVV